MSYILEALKKADAERERGAVPDLHAQPVLLATAYPEQPQRSPKPWLWLAAGAVIALGAVLAWQFSGSEAPPSGMPVPVPTAAPLPAPVLAGPQDAPALPGEPGASVTPPVVPTTPLAVAAPPPVPAPAPLAQREAEPLPAPTAQPAAPAKPRQQTAATAARTRADARAQAVAPAAPATAARSDPVASGAIAKAAKAASAPPAVARAPLLAELPEDFRRQVPAMTIGGSVYSQQPANRMVILNGQVFREGSTVTPGLVLEHIGPKSAVFSLGGQRFEMPY